MKSKQWTASRGQTTHRRFRITTSRVHLYLLLQTVCRKIHNAHIKLVVEFTFLQHLTCQCRASSVSPALWASESPLRYLFPTPFSPRHYQQGSEQQQYTISWGRNGNIDHTEKLQENALRTRGFARISRTQIGALATKFLPNSCPNPQGNDPFKLPSTLLIVLQNTACIPVPLYAWSWCIVGFLGGSVYLVLS